MRKLSWGNHVLDAFVWALWHLEAAWTTAMCRARRGLDPDMAHELSDHEDSRQRQAA